MKAPRLARLQSRFWGIVTSPAGVTEALSDLARTDPDAHPPTRWVDAQSSDEAAARLSIYAEMYFARLLETLRIDYPKVLALVGGDAFAALAREYLTAHPSTDPSVRHVGAKLPGFLREHSLTRHFPYLPDLAELEWARGDVFDRPDGAPLSAESLREVPPERWPALVFDAIAGLRWLDLDYPADDVWAALDADDPVPSIAPGSTRVLVWRREFTVLHRRVTGGEAEALRRVLRGAPFAEVCEPIGDAHAAAAALAGWVRDGILARLRDS